jgi:hypothetical protein
MASNAAGAVISIRTYWDRSSIAGLVSSRRRTRWLLRGIAAEAINAPHAQRKFEALID